MNDFLARLNILNQTIKELNDMGCNIFDIENPEYVIDEIIYEKNEDELFFTTKQK